MSSMGESREGDSRAGVAARAGTILLVVGLVLVAGALIGALLLLATSAGGQEGSPASSPVNAAARPGDDGTTPLRVSAATKHLLVGAAVSVEPLQDDHAYRTTLASEYNAVTPENAMKWDLIHPEAGRYDFEPADAITTFARKHDMTVRGHTLVWYRAVPAWVTDRSWTRPELERVLRDHIHTVVRRYRGTVKQWDVVNEAIDDNGNLRDSVWLRVIGPEYIDLAFRWAHEADPDAQLFYNDFDLEFPGAKADAVRALVRGLQSRGVPIDGVGIQAHEVTMRKPTGQQMEGALRSYAELGLDVAITELDVGVFLPATPEKLREQAAVYRDVLDVCLAVSRCHTFVTWGFTDGHSWIPSELPGFGAALPFDSSYLPKPAAAALRTRLARSRT